jgi:protease I
LNFGFYLIKCQGAKGQNSRLVPLLRGGFMIKRLIILTICFLLISVSFAGSGFGFSKSKYLKKEGKMTKKVVMIVANNGFRDEEYEIPKNIFTKAGLTVVTAAKHSGVATGKLGLKINIDIIMDKLNVADYDAVLFVGGPGCYDYYDDAKAHEIAKQAYNNHKILGAICAAPGILANAGLLQGKKATMFADDGTLAKSGATYTGADVEVDGKIVTATGPRTAKAWAETIIKML